MNETVIDVESREVAPSHEAVDLSATAGTPAAGAEPEEAPAAPVLEQTTALARLDPIKKVLADLREEIASTPFDINTSAGEKIARELRQKCIAVRTGADKLYKELNAPLLAVQRGWREQVKSIEEGVTPLETPIDNAIKAREAEREAEKQRKIAEEQARIAALRKKISEIAAIPAGAVKMNAAALDQAMLDLQAVVIDENSFGEFADEAGVLRNEIMTQLGEMLTSRRQQEAEADRLSAAAEKQRIESERMLAERALRTRIDAIRSRAFEAIGKPAAEISKVLEAIIAAEPIALEFGDLFAEASSAWAATKSAVESALRGQRDIEAQQAEQKRVADEQAERQRQLDEEENARALRLAAEEAARNPQPAAQEAVEPPPQVVAAPAPAPAPAPTPAAQAPTPESAEPGEWKRVDDLVFRLRNGTNYDEIRVTSAGGSRDMLERAAKAQQILEIILHSEEEQHA